MVLSLNRIKSKLPQIPEGYSQKTNRHQQQVCYSNIYIQFWDIFTHGFEYEGLFVWSAMPQLDCDLSRTTNKMSTCGGLAQLVECALCKREAPGSKPGFSTSSWSYSVMVITLDFESSDPGSNPGRTFFGQFFNCFLQAIMLFIQQSNELKRVEMQCVKKLNRKTQMLD